MAYRTLHGLDDIFTVRLNDEKVKLRCCDCGLVHYLVIVRGDHKGEVAVALARDQKATLAYRKRNRIIVRKNGKNIPK
jgi:hypothetical protein